MTTPFFSVFTKHSPLFFSIFTKRPPLSSHTYDVSRCGISNAVDGTEDQLIRDDIPREVDMHEDDYDDTINPDDDIDELEFFSVTNMCL